MITPTIKFRTASLDESLELIGEFLKSNWGRPRLLMNFPDLDARLKDKEGEQYEYELQRYFEDVQKKANLKEAAARFEKSWTQINDKYMNALSDVVEIDWPADCKKIIARVSINPICPRFLQKRMFDLYHKSTNERMRETTTHELLHFIYFEKWKQVFPETPEHEFETPHLVWRLSEIVPQTVLSDARIQKVMPHEPRVYQEFYKIVINDKPLLEQIADFYIHRRDFADFLKRAYVFAKQHETELTNF